jgi:hypothetical protein
MDGELYNPCDQCDRKYVAGMVDSGTDPCVGCRFDTAKKRLAKLEEIQKKCLGAYGILGEAFETRYDMTRRMLQIPILHLLTVGRAACADMPADLRSRIAKTIGDGIQQAKSTVEVDLESLRSLVDVSANFSMGGHDEQKAYLKSMNYLRKKVKTYEVLDHGRDADGK